MLRDVWNRLVRRSRDVTVEREAERERMSSAERQFAEESIDDIQADEIVSEHIGSIPPERLLREDESRRS